MGREISQAHATEKATESTGAPDNKDVQVVQLEALENRIEVADADEMLEIRDLQGLLRCAYQSLGKRLTLPKNVYEGINSEPPDPIEQEPACLVVDELGMKDRLLEVPLRLLVDSDAEGVSTDLEKRLLRVVVHALSLHRVCDSEEVREVLEGASDDDRIGAAFSRLNLSVDRLPSIAEAGTEYGFKKSEREKLRSNVMGALALFVAIRDNWPLDRFVRCLHEHCWQHALRGSRSKNLRPAIAGSRTPDLLGAVAQGFANRALLAERKAVELGETRDLLVSQLDVVERELEEREIRLAKSNEEVLALKVQLTHIEKLIEDERKERAIAHSHHVDDYEALRTRAIRLLDAQSRLLLDGLHALRNDRYAIADEYIDRVREAIERDLKALRSREVQN